MSKLSYDDCFNPPLIRQMLPIENVDGRELWEQGDLCRRKSASEVDLNRNYDFAWQLQVGSFWRMQGRFLDVLTSTTVMPPNRQRTVTCMEGNRPSVSPSQNISGTKPQNGNPRWDGPSSLLAESCISKRLI